MAVLELLKPFAPAIGVCEYAAVQEHLLPCRAKSRLPQHAESVIVLLFPYRFADTAAPRTLSRYACVPDYHTAAGAVLENAVKTLQDAYPSHYFIPFIDNSPIPEVRAAALAGLGVIGQHSLLIHPQYGSYVFIGEIVTDMAIPATGNTVTFCDGCGACSAACIGGCLPNDTRTTCASAVSQKKGDLSTAEIALIKQSGLVWGCDICQEVCPHNADALIAPHPCFTDYTPQYIPDDPLFATRAYAWRGQAVIERNNAFYK